MLQPCCLTVVRSGLRNGNCDIESVHTTMMGALRERVLRTLEKNLRIELNHVSQWQEEKLSFHTCPL